MLEGAAAKVNGQIFNIGSAANNYQLGPLAERSCARSCPSRVKIEWYGDADHRSYQGQLRQGRGARLEGKYTARDGAPRSRQAWNGRGRQDHRDDHARVVQELTQWHQVIKEVELHGGIVNINL